ncbi:ANTAR domain-containing protein [Rhizobium sp. BR 317]|uniref:ANTAR domain-containing response regulator n=1 Tax=Rhizobium sp. BR 317 TaxID=3040015 RepID=UPI0039BFDC59
MSRFERPMFSSWRAVILHRPHPAVEALTRQLDSLHIQVRAVWPQLDEQDALADVVFFDADMGHDQQFPWPSGFSPMPLVALIGSEAPGRIEWVLAQGSNAHMLKPIGSTGAYSALLIASHVYQKARGDADDIRTLEDRLRQRPIVVRAVLQLMQQGYAGEATAFKRLRSISMDWGMTIEEAADAICKNDRRTRGGL